MIGSRKLWPKLIKLRFGQDCKFLDKKAKKGISFSHEKKSIDFSLQTSSLNIEFFRQWYFLKSDIGKAQC